MRTEERQQYRERKREKERRRRIRRRRRLLRLYSLVLVLCVLTLGVWGVSRWMQKDSPLSYEISAPVVRSEEETLETLQNMAKGSRDLQKILDRAEEYPPELLAALANNLEMLEFVSGYLEQSGSAQDGASSSPQLTAKEEKERYPLFLQWDQRWGYLPYGNSNIGMSGCGPTCLSMAVHALTGDNSVTPASLARFSEEQGYYVEGTGTSWSLMTDGAAAWGLTEKELSLDESIMKRELDAGRLIICAMGPGDFTTAGHFILIYGYTESGFQVNDPNCQARSGRVWTYEELSSQIRNLWSYQV